MSSGIKQRKVQEKVYLLSEALYPLRSLEHRVIKNKHDYIDVLGTKRYYQLIDQFEAIAKSLEKHRNELKDLSYIFNDQIELKRRKK